MHPIHVGNRTDLYIATMSVQCRKVNRTSLTLSVTRPSVTVGDLRRSWTYCHTDYREPAEECPGVEGE